MFVKALCKNDCSINQFYENNYWGSSVCWAFWEVGPNDSKIRQLLVSSCLQPGWRARQGNQLSILQCEKCPESNQGSQERLLRAEWLSPTPTFPVLQKNLPSVSDLLFIKTYKKNLSWVLFPFYSFTVIDTSHTVCPSYGFCLLKNPAESWENLSESESYVQATNTGITATIKISQITKWWQL